MKGFFVTLLVVCGLVAAGWFLYEPYLKPLVTRFTSVPTMVERDRVIGADEPSATSSKAPTTSASGTAPMATTTDSTATVASPAPPESELERLLKVRYPMPEILPLLTIVDQWRKVPPNAFPAEITARETIVFELVIDGQVAGSSQVSPGTPLKPVRLEGEEIVVASLANPAMSTRLPVRLTDFRERIKARYDQFVAAKTAEVEAKRNRARALVEEEPARIALLKGKSLASSPPDSQDDPRFAPVKESLRQGEVASVTLGEAVSYRWNGPETVGGDYAGSYDTVTVNFEVSTIFGRFPVEYKALLKGGRVFAWIDPVTEDRI